MGVPGDRGACRGATPASIAAPNISKRRRPLLRSPPALLAAAATLAACLSREGATSFTPLGFGFRSAHLIRVGPPPRPPRPAPVSLPPRRRHMNLVGRAALRLSTLVCGVIGAGCVFAAAPPVAPLPRATLAATSAFVTAFGGGAQAEALRWFLRCAREGRKVAAPAFAWRCVHERSLAGAGFLIALLLELSGGCCRLLTEPWWRSLTCLMMGFLVAVAVARDGWFLRAGGRAWWCASWLGTFLYVFGGGLWRDVLLVGRPPAALAAGTLFALTAGALLCSQLRTLGEEEGAGLALLAGTPATACLFAVFA